jgi:type VII secretion protein EccE
MRHSGQLVALEIALAVIGYAALNRALWLVPTGLLGAAVIVVRWRGRWLFQWLPSMARLNRRPVAVTDGAHLVAGLRPGAVIEDADGGHGVLVTADGHSALLAIAEPADLVVEGQPTAGDGWAHALCIAAGAAADGPAVSVQLIVQAVPAPLARVAGTVAGASYRQLTAGQVPASRRAWVAVTARRGGPAWTEQWLRCTVLGAAGKARRELAKAGLGARPVPADGYRAALTAILGGTGGGRLKPGWAGVDHGVEASYPLRLHRWPTRPVAGGLLRSLSAIPARTVTTAVTVSPGRAALALRLTGPRRHVEGASAAVRQQLSGSGAALRRYTGEQLTGLIDTLPLGAPARTSHRATAAMIAGLGSPLTEAGLLLGRNRRDSPVTVRLLRAEPTRAVLFGGPTVAALLAVRALGLGAHVAVQSTRPQRWAAFERGLTGLPVHLVALGQPLGAATAGPDQPQLIVTDAGRHMVDLPPDSHPWRSHLLVRDELTGYDLDSLAYADLVLLQPLPPEAASLIAAALGRPEAADWLSRIRPDMLAVIARNADGRRPAVRWARLTITPTENQLLVTAS